MTAVFKKWHSFIAAHPLRNALLILTTAVGTGALALSLQTAARLDRLVEETAGGSERRIVIANAEIGVDGELSWTMPFQFSERDRGEFTSNVKGVRSVSIVNRMPIDQIQAGNQYWKPSGVLGTDQFYADVMGLELVYGSFYSESNLSGKEKVIVISARAAAVLFGDAARATGKTILLDNGFRMGGRRLAGGRGANAEIQTSPWAPYTVIGVFADPTRFEADNYGIPDFLIPYTSLLPTGMNFSMPVRMFMARVSATAVENVESAIRTEMDSRTGSRVSVAVWEGAPDSPGVSSIGKARRSLQDLSLVSSGLGVLILTIASFGIVSGLLVDAADRAKEIALKRAIGMTVRRGTAELCERSVTLAGAGGILGLLVATLLSPAMRDILVPFLDALGVSSADLTARAFEPRTLLAPLAALSLAFVFSLFPAARAASSPIVDGLKE